MWRRSVLLLGGEAVARINLQGTASRSSGSKLPRHEVLTIDQCLLPPAQVGEAGAVSTCAHSSGV